MVRRLTKIGTPLLPLLFFVIATAGCGGDATTTATEPNPPPGPGPVVTGTIRLPNPSDGGKVEPVPRNFTVSIQRLLDQGQPQDPPYFQSTTTNDQGGYRFTLKNGTTPDTPNGRYIIVASDPNGGVARGFVFSTDPTPVDIDYASDAAVTLILAAVGNPSRNAVLSDFSPDEIASIVGDIRRTVGTLTGSSSAEVNAEALGIASGTPEIVALIGAAIGTPTVTPSPLFSNTPAPTSTLTFTPANTSTPVNTSTPISTLTRTHTPVPSSTPVNTLVPTSTHTIPPTATFTNTTVPTASNTTAPTNTPTTAPSNTPTNPPASTSTPTNTVLVPTNTPANTPIDTPTNPAGTAAPTDTPTNTALAATATPTATVPAPTATPSVTPTSTSTPMALASIAVTLAPAGGTTASCRGVCSGGTFAGMSCGQTSDCPGGTCPAPKKCVGGPYDGLACSAAKNCNGCSPNTICTAAGTPLSCCTQNAAGTCPVVGSCALISGSPLSIAVGLNGVCLPRSNPPGDVACSTDAECHICVGGTNDGKTCLNLSTDCPGGACSKPGTCRLAQLSLVPGTEDPTTHEIPLTIPQSSLVLNPATITGVGTVCVSASGDGNGEIDCDGGRANLSAALTRDHNTSPNKTCITGPKIGTACTSNTNCTVGSNTGICNLGDGDTTHFPDDPSCTNKQVEPDGSTSYACPESSKQCSGGSNAGATCTADSDCGGGSCSYCNLSATATCSGGTNIGDSCSTNSDCPGSTCVFKVNDPGVCNSPSKTVLSGSFGAGDMQISLPLAITQLGTGTTSFGPDGLACTADDTASPSPGVSVALSTGTNSVTIYDANNTAAFTLSGTIAGKGTSCANLAAGNISGAKFGGGFPALSVSPLDDIATLFQFIAQ